MAKKATPVNLSAIAQVAQTMSQQDQAVAAQTQLDRGQRGLVLLEQIKARPSSTRTLRPDHVKMLEQTIGELGLLEPIVVDNHNRLLAGAHRLAAIRALKEQNPAIYGEKFPGEGIPVRVMPFNSEQEPELALQCEIAENEHRRDYTPAETRALAERLKQAGYIQLERRPRAGEKALGPALEAIVGKHIRTIRRHLNQKPGAQQLSRTNVLLKQERQFLQQCRLGLRKWQQQHQSGSAARQQLTEALPDFLQVLEGVLAEINQDLS